MPVPRATLWLLLGAPGCVPGGMPVPEPVTQSVPAAGLHPGKVVLIAAGAVSALIVLLLIVEGATLND